MNEITYNELSYAEQREKTRMYYSVGEYLQLFGKPNKHQINKLEFTYRQPIESALILHLKFPITQRLEYNNCSIYTIHLYGMEYVYYKVPYPYNGEDKLIFKE